MILQAQASGLPVVAVGVGGPRALIEHGRTGLLCPPEVTALADAVCEYALSAPLRRRIAAAALRSVRVRTWDLTLERLADGYGRALAASAPTRVVSAGADRRTAA